LFFGTLDELKEKYHNEELEKIFLEMTADE
jgi:hypothetical protein